MARDDSTLLIVYNEGLLTSDDQQELQKALNGNIHIAFWPKKNGPMNAAFDEIFTVLSIAISPDVWEQFFSGIAVSAAIGAVKLLGRELKKILSKKKVYKVTANTIEEPKPTIGIRGPNINIILPADISDEKFEYCIDKAFESIQVSSQKISKEETITYHNDTTGDTITYTFTEYYWNVVEPKIRQKEVSQENETTI